MNSLILLRGLPGSGKTTFAEIISENGKYPMFSVDDYFIDSKGVYNFEFEKNYLAYKNCENLTLKAIKENTKKIIVHNTFTQKWELDVYFKLAKKYNYTVFVVTIENYHKNNNVHNINEEQILKMAKKYKIALY